MQAEVRFAATVVQTNGTPIALAEALFQSADRSSRRTFPIEQGKLSFVEAKPEEGQLMVSATNFSPRLLPLKLNYGVKETNIVLTSGNSLQANLRDQNNVAIADAAVSLEEWNGTSLLKWKAESDAAGKISWSNAPLGTLVLAITKANYSLLRTNVALPRTNDLLLVMRKEPGPSPALSAQAKQ
jgi:hypothetical protein